MIDVTGYSQTLGIGAPVQERIQALCAIWERICPSELESIFVSEYLSEDGDRQYESLWIIAKKHLIELPQFVTENRGDIVPLDQNVTRIEIDRRDFEFQDPTPASRLTITGSFTDTLMLTGTFKASGENCSRLQELLEHYLLPNLAAL